VNLKSLSILIFHCIKSQNVWSYTSAHPYFFIAWYLVKHRDNLFSFTVVCKCWSSIKLLVALRATVLMNHIIYY